MSSCTNLIIVIISFHLIMNVLKKPIYKYIVGIATVLFLMNNIEGLENQNDPIVSNNTVSNDGSEPGVQKKSKTMNMGPYDGICLKTGNNEYWMKSPDETALVPNDGLYSYLSSQGPIKMRLSDQASLIGPPVDGVKGSPEKMFMWANNVTSPLCCPSTFSTSTGCVCSSKNQRDFIAARGMLEGDKNYDVSTDEVE